MRTTILYAGTLVAVVQIFYLAPLAAQHSEPTIDADAAIAEAFERRPLRAQDYAAPLPQKHDEPTAAHAQPHDYAARDALLGSTKQCRVPGGAEDDGRSTSRATASRPSPNISTPNSRDTTPGFGGEDRDRVRRKVCTRFGAVESV